MNDWISAPVDFEAVPDFAATSLPVETTLITFTSFNWAKALNSVYLAEIIISSPKFTSAPLWQ